MPTAGLRDQIDRARRLLADHLARPDALRRHEQRLAAWGEQPDEFLKTVALVLGLALYQVGRGSARAHSPRTSDASRHDVTRLHITRLLDPEAAGLDLLAGLPDALDPDSLRRIQALRLASAGISPAATIRWTRLLRTAYDVAEHQV